MTTHPQNDIVNSTHANMPDVMVDIETTSTGPDAAIVSIGAVAFDYAAGVLGPTFYTTINLASAIAAGGQVDADTMVWWLKQSDAARDVFSSGAQLGISEALDNFTLWLHEECAPRDQIRLWGNGADFDPVILATTYRRMGVKTPWDFWNTRCFRTLRAEYPNIKYERTGTIHNALDDAINQALHMLKLDAAKPVCSCPGSDGSLRWPCAAHPAPSAFARELHDADREDAARWRETLLYVGASATGDHCSRFTLRYLNPVAGADLMRGSVAGHFTAAIDATRKATS